MVTPIARLVRFSGPKMVLSGHVLVICVLDKVGRVAISRRMARLRG
jgi:hypothetical protein